MINVEQSYNDLKISYYNTTGGITIETVPIPKSEMFVWKQCETSEDLKYAVKGIVSQEGKPVRKVGKKYLDKFRKIEFLMSLPEETKKRIFAYNVPKKWYVDIETEIIGGLNVNEATENPKGKILSIAFCNEQGDVYIVGTQKLGNTQKERISDRINDYFKSLGRTYKVHFKFYETEAMMMADLMYNYFPKMALITGWNFLKFDWKYMYNRCGQLNVDANKVSPTGNTFKMSIRDKWNKKMRYLVDLPMHRGIVDYMAIFEKWDTSVKLKSSMSLDAIAHEVLGLQKVPYSGSLTDLYKNDYEGFLFYNAVDTILVAEIDRKCQTFNTMLMLASEGKVALHDSAFASDILTSLFSEEYYKRGVVFVKEDVEYDNESYSGGYVEEPGKGLKQGVVVFDYESLFPSIMLMLNTGIETLVGHTHDEGKTYVGIKDKQVHKFNPEIHTWGASGVVYDKTKDSVMRSVVSNLFNQRIEAKTASAEIESEIVELKRMLKKTA